MNTTSSVLCSCYSVLRNKYINICYYVEPSMYKYIQLLKSTNKIKLIKHSIYALQMRADASTVNVIIYVLR